METRADELKRLIPAREKLLEAMHPIVLLADAHPAGFSALSSYINYDLLNQFKDQFLNTATGEHLPFERNQAAYRAAQSMSHSIVSLPEDYRKMNEEVKRWKEQLDIILKSAKERKNKLVSTEEG